MFTTGIEGPQVPELAKFYYQVRTGTKTQRYQAIVGQDRLFVLGQVPQVHYHRFVCIANSIPTDVLLTDIRIVIVEPGGKESLCYPANFDGRAVLLSTPKAVVSINGWKRRAKKQGRIPDNEARIACPTGLRSLAGLKFVWEKLK